MQEKKRRSMAKAISWRLSATIDTFIISFLVTGQFRFAISISVIEVATKILWYYFHERIWDKINFGRVKPPEYQI